MNGARYHSAHERPVWQDRREHQGLQAGCYRTDLMYSIATVALIILVESSTLTNAAVRAQSLLSTTVLLKRDAIAWWP